MYTIEIGKHCKPELHLLCWLSKLKKLIEENLAKRLNFNVCSFMNNTKNCWNIFPVLENYYLMNREALTSLPKCSPNIHLCCFTFILLINVKKIINIHVWTSVAWVTSLLNWILTKYDLLPNIIAAVGWLWVQEFGKNHWNQFENQWAI